MIEGFHLLNGKMDLIIYLLLGGLVLALITTAVFTYIGYSAFKKVDNSEMSNNFHNYAANNPGTMSSMGPWGSAISGISKARGFGSA